MSRVIQLPDTLDENTFEELISDLESARQGERLLFDARHVRWVSPYGLIGLLACKETVW